MCYTYDIMIKKRLSNVYKLNLTKSRLKKYNIEDVDLFIEKVGLIPKRCSRLMRYDSTLPHSVTNSYWSGSKGHKILKHMKGEYIRISNREDCRFLTLGQFLSEVPEPKSVNYKLFRKCDYVVWDKGNVEWRLNEGDLLTIDGITYEIIAWCHLLKVSPMRVGQMILNGQDPIPRIYNAYYAFKRDWLEHKSINTKILGKNPFKYIYYYAPRRSFGVKYYKHTRQFKRIEDALDHLYFLMELN